MPNFFSSIFKQKKIIFFVVCFFIFSIALFGIKIDVAEAGCVPMCVPPRVCVVEPSGGYHCSSPESVGPKEEIQKEKRGDECKENLSWWKSILAALVDISVLIPKTLADWSTWLASYIISWVSTWPITHPIPEKPIVGSRAFLSGWTSVRDLANMLVVLGFVIVGIATTLRIREYEAKKALLPLIIVALLINFSGLFVGLIIDASNLTMSGLLSSGQEGTMGLNFFSNIQEKEKGAACEAMGKNNLSAYAAVSLGYAFIYLAVAVAFIYLAFILIARYAVLGILFILSPLAFAFWAFPFPKAKDLWNKWWESFLKWAFIGVGISFFLNITAQMLEALPIKDPKEATFSTLFFYLIIVLIFLAVGIKITTKTSAMGAAAVMGLASGGIGLALGAVAGASKIAGTTALGAGKRMADSKAGQWTGKQLGKMGSAMGSTKIGQGFKKLGKGAGWTGGQMAKTYREGRTTIDKSRSAYGKALEGIGARDLGQTAFEKSEGLGKDQKRFEALIQEGRLDKVLEAAEGKGAGVNAKERGAAIGALLETKNFDAGNDKLMTGLKNFQDRGGNINKYAEKNPMLAEHNIGAVQNTLATENTPAKVAARGYEITETEAKVIVRDKAYAGMSVKDLRDSSPHAVNMHLLANVPTSKLKKASDEFSGKKISEYKKLITTGTPENEAVNDEIARLTATGDPDDAEKATRIINNMAEIGTNPNFL